MKEQQLNIEANLNTIKDYASWTVTTYYYVDSTIKKTQFQIPVLSSQGIMILLTCKSALRE